MAAKSNKTPIYFNNQAFIIPHSDVNKLPESFKGEVINLDGYLIGVPNGMRYTGYIDINNIVTTPVYTNEYVQLYTTDVAQNGIGWLDYDTAVIADGHQLLYVKTCLCRPDIWYRVGSGVKHVFNNVGKRVGVASTDLTSYLVINDYVIKAADVESLARSDLGDYTVINHCAVMPEWTLSEIELAGLNNYNEFTNNSGDYTLLFPDGARQYLLVHHTLVSNPHDTVDLRFWSELSQLELNNKIKENFPTLHYMLLSLDYDRRRGNSFVLGVRCSRRVYDAVSRFIGTIDN